MVYEPASVPHGAPDVDAVAASATYRELIERLKQRIRESQARAARAVNTELVMLYWSIGREIVEKQQTSGWGDDIVGRIAQDSAADIGSPRGFSRRNLSTCGDSPRHGPTAESAISDGTNRLDVASLADGIASAIFNSFTPGMPRRRRGTTGQSGSSRVRSICACTSARVLP